MMMMLSVYLGLFNLLPLPALDGGRALFLALESVTRTQGRIRASRRPCTRRASCCCSACCWWSASRTSSGRANGVARRRRRGAGPPGRGSAIHDGLVGARALVGHAVPGRSPTLRREYERDIAPRTRAALAKILAEVYPADTAAPGRALDLGTGTGAASAGAARAFRRQPRHRRRRSRRPPRGW